MSYPVFNLPRDYSTSRQHNVTNLKITTTQDKRIEFSKVHYHHAEGRPQDMTSEKLNITQDEGYGECMSDVKCKAFFQELQRQGFNADLQKGRWS